MKRRDPVVMMTGVAVVCLMVLLFIALAALLVVIL